MESEVSRLRKKVENYPSPSAYNRLAELLRISGDHDGALDACKRCIREFPRNGQAYVIVATIELGQGKRAEALEQLDLAVEKDPRCYSGFRMLADLKAEDGDTAGAIELLQRVLVFKPDDQGVKERIADLSAAAPAAQPAAAPASSGPTGETDTIDLSQMGSLSSSGVMTSPFAQQPSSPKAAAAPATPQRGDPLAGLVSETGVRGAVISDDQGRAVAESKLSPGQGDILAALATEISNSAGAALAALGDSQVTNWSIQASDGQILAYRRNLNVITVADTEVKGALLELRARQALIDMGET